MQTWSPEDYGGNAVCHTVLQHPDTGYIYVGSNGNILEYDGARWRLLLAAGVRALALDRRGRVWFASVENVGFLAPDALGELRIVSALARVPEAQRELPPIFNALAADGGIYVATRRALLFFTDGDDTSTARAWPLRAPPAGLWLDGRTAHLSLEDGVTYQVVNDELKPAAARPRGTLGVSGDIALTRRGPVPTPRADPLGGDTANAILTLADGRTAFGTEASGVLLFDRAGRLLQRLDRALGLPSNRANGLHEDREGGLWIAMQRGLARVQLDSPFAVHGRAQNFEAAPTGVHRFDGRLYVTHTEGIAVQEANGTFSPVRRLPGSPADSLRDATTVFTSAVLQRTLPAGVNSASRDRTPYTGALQLQGNPGAFATGSFDGVWFSDWNGKAWQAGGHLQETSGHSLIFVEAPAGLLWFMGTDGLAHVDVRGGSARATAPRRVYGPADGLPEAVRGNVAMFELGGTAVAVMDGRFFRYIPARDRFEPETRIADLPPQLTIGLNTGMRVSADADGSRWMTFGPEGRRIIRLRPQSSPAGAEARWTAELIDTSSLAGQRLANAYHDPATHSLWLCIVGGALVSLDLNWQPARRPAVFAADMRRVEGLDGQTVIAFDGSSPGAPKKNLPLRPTQDALRFVFAAARFASGPDGAPKLQYRTRLDGLDADWTPWASTPFREFTNLPWHSFTFRVQARDGAGRESREDSLAFAIAAPWWATGGAMAGYFVLAGCGIFGLVRVRTRSLRRRADHLETIVAARTTELATKNIELTRLHQLELDEKTAARLAEEKTRLEMLRYQLNPHFLANSLAALRTMVGPQATGAREMIERLASFCRMALTRRDETATVRDEIEMLRAYLDTEKSRWRDTLEVTIEVDPAALDVSLPPFLLLPLVENAIKYGGQTSPDKLGLRLEFRADQQGTLSIRISNTGRWIPPETTGNTIDSGHIGLDNLRQRLRRHYPDAHEFTTQEENGWVVARLILKAELNANLR